MSERIRAYGKINLGLQVVRKRPDGYHDLRMVMVPIDLFDSIHVAPYEKLIIQSDKWYLPNDDRNTVYKAIRLMQENYGITQNYAVRIIKNIPTQAGLAGGSTDAAAMINYLNMKHQLNLSQQELIDIGVQVGADVPFCLFKRPALVEGIGERLTFLKGDFDFYLFIMKPKMGVSTGGLFKSLKVKPQSNDRFENLVQSIETNHYEGIQQNLMNDLLERATEIQPEIQLLIDELLAFGFDNASMTGSGSVVFGITRCEELCNRAVQAFYLKVPFVKKCKVVRDFSQNKVQ